RCQPRPRPAHPPTAPPTTSLHDALPIFAAFNAKWSTATWQSQILRGAQVWAQQSGLNFEVVSDSGGATGSGNYEQGDPTMGDIRDRKSTRLNSSHGSISYAVFCLKKKTP